MLNGGYQKNYIFLKKPLYEFYLTPIKFWYLIISISNQEGGRMVFIIAYDIADGITRPLELKGIINI